ncbi:hypothetical protein J2T56_002008 [Natronobacillus azotifigens]|uniref:Uncharacterized protein n=1 Tax=Natronobacillus azotifigens TaxID=472978 RepID=A0A9J6RE89_9BACI|nr:hypothetical protein [Natronobacillus azotifigens]MCZ0703781.1 hypothetical protein [Natronobacillus azotifigens]
MNEKWLQYYYNYPYYRFYPHYSAYLQQNPVFLGAEQQNEASTEEEQGEPFHEQMISPVDSVNMTEQLNKMFEIVSKMEADYREIKEEYQEIKKELKSIDPITIENVNYKIQDLNVQDLSGNLLVGLTTLSDAENLKKLLADEDSISFNDIDTEELNNQESMMDWEEQENNNEEGGNNQ